MSSIFTKIINGDIPCVKIYEDDRYFSFLDIRPINPGHALVIPRQETDYLFDLEDELLAGLTITAKKIARAIDQVVDCERVGLMVAGLEVPHCHIHLVPINGLGDLNFENAKEAKAEELKVMGEKIRALLGSSEG